MHTSVRMIWPEFSRRYEGRLPFMYLDIKGLVTTGIGNLADPVSLALRMPWRSADGSTATDAAIRAEWAAVKARKDLIQDPAAFKGVTELRLSSDGIDQIMTSKLLQNEAIIRQVWPAWDTFPADAQLGVLSMAWAMGPYFWQKFPRFTRHIAARDWTRAADECLISETGNPGVRGRNVANRACFLDAAFAEREITRVHWSKST